MKKQLRIATRKSPLALWQANYVKAEVNKLDPTLTVEIVGMSTKGDKILDSPLAKVGGKGLFVKELEVAILSGAADIAVHSMKDVPMELPKGLILGVICPREDPRDAFVSNQYNSLEQLPEGAVVGSSSLRRQCQLSVLRPDLKIQDLRGNVNTRLAKLDAGQYDAIILAAAGLVRLQMADRIRQCLAPEVSLPAGGQGAVGIEYRQDDKETHQLLSHLHDHLTATCVTAERSMNRHLNGGCQVPIACYAVRKPSGQLWLRGIVGQPDGTIMLRAELEGSQDQAERLGIDVAELLLEQGAAQILAQLQL